MTTRVAIHGAAGRMGLSIAKVIEEDASASLVGAFARTSRVEKGVDEPAGAKPTVLAFTDDVDAAIRDADVVIDFTHPTASVRLFEKLAERGLPVVIGTTGFDDAGLAAIRTLGTRVPVVYASNYSQGVTMLFHLAARAAKLLGAGFDAEIVEMHHRFKVDSPSGTAVELAEIVAAARGTTYAKSAVHARSGQVGKRTDSEIGVLALRGGDVVGEHTLSLAGLGERLELTHRATDRMIFARGAVRAAHWVVGQKPGVYDMFDVMGVER